MITLPIENGINAVLSQSEKAPIMFESFSLSENWCSAERREYLLVWDGEKLTCSLYYGCWRDDDEREESLEKRISLDKTAYEKLCGEFASVGMRSWLGKSYSNSDVLDGEGFNLSLTEKGKRFWSGGSNSWPEGYREFYDTLSNIFE